MPSEVEQPQQEQQQPSPAANVSTFTRTGGSESRTGAQMKRRHTAVSVFSTTRPAPCTLEHAVLYFKSHPLFRRCSSRILTDLAFHFKCYSFPGHSVICTQGEKIHHLLFVKTGHCRMLKRLAPSSSPHPAGSGEPPSPVVVELHTLEYNDFVGEEQMVLDHHTVAHQRHKVSVQTGKWGCEVYAAPIMDLHAIINFSTLPRVCATLKAVADMRHDAWSNDARLLAQIAREETWGAIKREIVLEEVDVGKVEAVVRAHEAG